MVDFEVTFRDKEPPVERKEILGYVFSKDIFLPRGFLDKDVVKGDVLDLGCGRGSVGAMLRQINPEIRLTGVDIVTSYQGENFLNQYSAVRNGDASSEVAIIKKDQKRVDLVISYGLPPKPIENLIKTGEIKDIVKSEGVVLLIFDAPIDYFLMKKAKKMGFELHEGSFPNDPYILFWASRSE
ncbi:hypothetical protein COT03_01250 [Candidatus Shapirobacteria bacterium CG07_land_8_20_14_0_80_39_18]|uniref:Methyltransferase small domain-containing protein n=1 Tax=Candidatus Shapirobacteria bacterium CG07_land_8_20_14_0_80_39_18 TaxID=1974882 RepID=A0A2M6YRI8_9BACT|nr:MAG: hypothetical protein COT03_01250 [Candidatus Shapirobacteria bacterium CG07_land_8_20_14_0_80_39_18]